MSSPWKTGCSSEALQALPELVELAELVLSHEKLKEADTTARMLVGSKTEKQYAKMKLLSLIPHRPTRPLLYLLPLLMQLPRLTRDSIRYLGDYIDLLTKEMTFEFVGGNARKSSLGKNVKALEKADAVPRDLIDKLKRYNRFLYTPGKHDFSLPPGRKHRFTSREVVLAVYISVELGERIKCISKLARLAVEKDNLYMIGGRWGSSNRIVYTEDQ